MISCHVMAKIKKGNALGGHDSESCFRSGRVNNQIIAALFFARVDKLMFAGGVVNKESPLRARRPCYENSFAFPECGGFIRHGRENILSIFAERVRNVRDNVRSFIRSFRFFRFFSPNAIVASRPMSPWPAIIARCREQERIRAILHSLLARPKKGEKSS